MRWKKNQKDRVRRPSLSQRRPSDMFYSFLATGPKSSDRAFFTGPWKTHMSRAVRRIDGFSAYIRWASKIRS